MAARKAVNKRAAEKQEADAQLRKVGAYLSARDKAGSADTKDRESRRRSRDMIRGVYSDAEERRLVGRKPVKKAKPVPKQASRVPDKAGPQKKAKPTRRPRTSKA